MLQLLKEIVTELRMLQHVPVQIHALRPQIAVGGLIRGGRRKRRRRRRVVAGFGIAAVVVFVASAAAHAVVAVPRPEDPRVRVRKSGQWRHLGARARTASPHQNGDRRRHRRHRRRPTGDDDATTTIILISCILANVAVVVALAHTFI